MSAGKILLWIIIPYAAIAIFITVRTWPRGQGEREPHA